MNSEATQASFWEHASVLRSTLIRCLCTMAGGVLLALCFYPQMFTILTLPLDKLSTNEKANVIEETLVWKRVQNTSPETAIIHGQRVAPGETADIAIPQKTVPLALFSPVEGMLSVLRISLWSGITLSSPIWLFWILQFVSPGLRPRERSLIFPFLVTSVAFFALGASFCYWFTLPIANQVLFGFNAQIGQNLWSLQSYLEYSSLLLLAHGLAFEGLVVLLFMIQYDKVSARSLRYYRKHTIVGFLIAAAILTPPDVITQCLLAAPLCLAYELLTLYARLREIRSKKKGLVKATRRYQH